MKPRTRQRVVFVASVVAVFLLGTSPTHAILNGTLDGNRHPNVGAVVAEVEGQRFSPCSGILIAPTVLVGAAHCLDFLEDVVATQVWVTFDSEANVETSQLIPGTMHPNPAFEANAPDPTTSP